MTGVSSAHFRNYVFAKKRYHVHETIGKSNKEVFNDINRNK